MQTTPSALVLERPPITLPIAQPLRYCLYARKSSEDDERQALSIDSQIKEMLLMAQKEGLEVAEIRRESHSAKDSGARPVYNDLIKDIKEGQFNALLTWATDRLSRNAGDLGRLVDLMDEGRLIDIRTHGQRFTNSPNEKFLLMILGSQAKLENDNRGLNVKRGLKNRAEMGHRPCMPPLGYMLKRNFNGKNKVLIDPVRAPIIRQAFEKVANGETTGRMLYKWMKEVGFMGLKGRPMVLSSIYRMLQNTYYFGMFEYPSGSGNWIRGDYDPLINKEMYDKVQKQLRQPPKSYAIKPFHFVKMLKCGECGSGITAEEKTKHYKNGKESKFVYYHCTRYVGKKECKQPFIREEDLLEQLIGLMDEVSLDQIGARKKLENEVLRFKRFTEGVLGQKSLPDKTRVDIRNYAKYILREGTRDEKREILSCLKSRIHLEDKRIYLK